ncbi:hypothetical protein KN400_3501 [Geobacter sulfurreducens KN400]|nr:hypothetical protein KN400_3501 [Geobacter sulfurreducens KN400]
MRGVWPRVFAGASRTEGTCGLRVVRGEGGCGWCRGLSRGLYSFVMTGNKQVGEVIEGRCELNRISMCRTDRGGLGTSLIKKCSGWLVNK